MFAQSVLRALFSTSRKPPQRQEEWTCKGCHVSNFKTRKFCRQCGAEPVTVIPPAPAGKKSASGAAPAAPKLAPWAKARAAASRATALEAALSAARAAGGDEELVKHLEGKLNTAQKQATDDRPLSDKVSGCREYISRAEKRFEKASDAAQEAVNQRDALAKDLEDHKKQLEALEKEAALTMDAEQSDGAEHTSVVDSARALLDALESSRIRDALTGELPEPLLEQMRLLRQSVDEVAPQPVETMELGEVAGGAVADTRAVDGDYVATQVGTQEPTEAEGDAATEDLYKRLSEANGRPSEDEATKQLIRSSLAGFRQRAGPY